MAERKHPDWIKVRAPVSPEYFRTKATARQMRLHTVCQEACCPNIGECFSHRTATFMLMGDVCTRNCPYCAVDARQGAPARSRRAAPRRGGRRAAGPAHVVVTSVDRDDLPDGGAAHFAATARAIKALHPATRVEVLVPDFQGSHRQRRRRGPRAGRYLQPQHRDRAEPLQNRASGRTLSALARRAATRQGHRARTAHATC